MEEKRELTRGQMCRLLGVSYDNVRYYEKIGKFRPIRTRDQYGQVVVLYPPGEMEKVREFYESKNLLYLTTWVPR